MFKWRYNNKFSFSIESSNGEVVKFSEWNKFNSEYLSELSILQDLIENEEAIVSEYFVEVDAENILSLDFIDTESLCLPNELKSLKALSSFDLNKKLLGLPEPYPFSILIEPDGIMSQKSFKFKYGFFDFIPNGNRLFYQRIGPIIQNDNSQYLLSLNQFKILEAIDSFNYLPESQRTFHHNLTCFTDIKTLSDDVAILLDDFLKIQNVHQPEKIKIDVSFENGILNLTPKIDAINQEAFVKDFDRNEKIKSVYNVSSLNGGTTRVIITEEQSKQLAKIKSNRRISEPDLINDIAENPENYFDDDFIDLKYFSERVREIGVYKPKFYPFVCPYKSEWIPGFVIKDKLNGDKKIRFRNPEDLAEFMKEQEIAVQEGRSEFTYKEEQVSVKDAGIIIAVATKQFENPKEPIIKETSSKSDEVLIIKENADLLEYLEKNQNPESISKHFSKISNLTPPIELKEHQIEGVSWLQSLFSANLNGCLLADDMGLGKTLQLLYFIEWHAQNNHDDKPYLIVAPVSLLENWQREYNNFFSPKNLELRLLHSSSGIEKEFSRKTVSELQQKQVILTNYEFLRTHQLNLCAVDYAVVALDEAQKIKTPGTLITNVSKALKADFKVAMTGTPVENTFMDLWCIMDFCLPGFLGNAKDFSRQFQAPLTNNETDIQELGKNLREKIDSFLMRRFKSDDRIAADLPQKHSKIITKEMPEVQANRYAEEIELANNHELEGVEKRNQILKSLWAIRDISDHPYLLDKQINMHSSAELITSSAKLQIIVDELEQIQRINEKAIIFADRKDTQKMLQKVVYETFNIAPPSIINGDTISSKQKENSRKLSRQQTIDRFENEEGFNVIIMSQLAAGVGLNVVGANHVIHYSRHWNPAKEEQATDRAYRIGQTKDVTVYYPMAVFPERFKNENGEKQKSFDEVLDGLLSRKKSLANSTLFPSEQSEVRPDEILEDVFGIVNAESNRKALSIEDIDRLNPRLFEAFVAALYAKLDFHVHLTPLANDKGADVVALSSNGNFLIQAKQSQSSVSNDAIQEIVTSKPYYENKFKETFTMVVLTNNFYGTSAITLGEFNKVKLIDRKELEELIRYSEITLKDIYKCENQRLSQI